MSERFQVAPSFTLEKVPIQSSSVENVLESFSQAVDEHSPADNDRLQDQLRSGLHKSLNGPQIGGLCQPTWLAMGAQKAEWEIVNLL